MELVDEARGTKRERERMREERRSETLLKILLINTAQRVATLHFAALATIGVRRYRFAI